MTHGSLFSGIGGFDLAAEWMGWENKFHCEKELFLQSILKYYWPDAKLYDDITTADFTIWRGKIDILTGGFPCQPYSVAGKQLGKEDDRHLWPEMLRAIREIKPTWVVGENVRGLVSWNGGMVFDEVQADLEAEGYEVQPFLLPAAGVGAPHERYRIWFVAFNANNKGSSSGFGTIQEKNGEIPKRNNNAKSCNSGDEIITNTDSKLLKGRSSKNQSQTTVRHTSTSFYSNPWANFPTQSPICGGNDGLPTELDNITFPKWRNESIKGHGNAIVPQVVLQIFKAIEQYEGLNYGN